MLKSTADFKSTPTFPAIQQAVLRTCTQVVYIAVEFVECCLYAVFMCRIGKQTVVLLTAHIGKFTFNHFFKFTVQECAPNAKVLCKRSKELMLL